MSDVTVTVTESNPIITVSGDSVDVAVTENTVTITDADYMKYGAFQYLGRQAITSTTSEFIMPLDTTDFTGNVYISNNKIYFPTAGIYNIQWSGQFENSANALEDIYVWLKINGTNIAGSTGYISIPARKSAGNPAHMITGWNYFIQVTAGQYLEIAWSATSTNVSLESYATQTNPTRPSTAAVVVTAQQVA
jgi:hypothetical protein